MGFEFDFLVELAVIEGRIENECLVSKEGVRDQLGITFEVRAEITLENDRPLTGEIHFYNSENSTAEDQKGDWIFYTLNRFRADIYLPTPQLERMWVVFSSEPQWFFISLGEGPEVPLLARHYEGDFRVNYRAGLIVPPTRR